MLTFGFEADEALQALETIPSLIDRQRPQLLVRAATAIKHEAHADLMVKARGGAGIDGTTWKKVTPAEARRKSRLGKPLLGIRTGQMLAVKNLDIWQRGEEVVIDFGPGPADIEKAAIFDSERQLFPKELPKPWYHRASMSVQSAVDAVVNGIAP